MYGYDIMIDPKDELVSKTIKEFGSYKPENIRAFGKLVKEGDTILIVGSHVGLSAIVYAKLAGSKGKLFIIEPYSISFKLASKNVCINDLSNITTLFRKAVSNKTGKG
jgi:predicted O-methyltransferase YrrM